MSQFRKVQVKTLGIAKKKVSRKTVRPRVVRRFEKTRPRRFMNPFLCFAHEERVKANKGRLLSDWKEAHKGLGAKWRALGAGKEKFLKQGKIPGFAAFVKESPQRKELLPIWRNTHKGLDGKWKRLDKSGKAKYVDASKKMKAAYEQQMKVYRIKKQELLRQVRAAKKAKKAPRKEKKILKALMKKSKKIKAARKQKSKGIAKHKKVAKKAAKKSKKGMKGVARKINTRIRVTCISSRAMQ